jgi:hypothetical protein
MVEKTTKSFALNMDLQQVVNLGDVTPSHLDLPPKVSRNPEILVD